MACARFMPSGWLWVTPAEMKITEFTVDKPIGRDSGNWIKFWSDDLHLNAGVVATWDDDCFSGNKRVVTKQELISIDYDGCVIQIYME